jgi:ArsR family transcriptional regulator
MEKFNIGPPTISHHLKELENADLITAERKGKLLVTQVNTPTLKEFSDIKKIKNF